LEPLEFTDFERDLQTITRGALRFVRCWSGASKAAIETGKEGKSVQDRRGRQKNSGAPTPAGVCLDDLIQKFADDQHGEGLIHTSRHSNLAGQSVQYGTRQGWRNKSALHDRWQKAGSFWYCRFVHYNNK